MSCEENSRMERNFFFLFLHLSRARARRLSETLFFYSWKYTGREEEEEVLDDTGRWTALLYSVDAYVSRKTTYVYHYTYMYIRVWGFVDTIT